MLCTPFATDLEIAALALLAMLCFMQGMVVHRVFVE